jgi:hypothetical protein
LNRSNHKNNVQKTSWSDLKEIGLMKDEEHDLKIMLGIPILKSNAKGSGFDGGASPNFKKELSHSKLEGILNSSVEMNSNFEIQRNSG